MCSFVELAHLLRVLELELVHVLEPLGLGDEDAALQQLQLLA